MGSSKRNGILAGAFAFAAVAVIFALYTNNQPMLDPKEAEREAEQITRELKPVQPNTVADYDWERSTQNLKKIGKAMLQYRAAHPSLPVSQRQSWHDAGLPEHLYLALTEPGQPWTIPRETFVMQIEHGKYVEEWLKKGIRYSDYQQQYAIGSYSLDSAEKIQRAWATKGENMIVLSDNCMNSQLFRGSLYEAPKKTEILVLRLKGRVERIRIDSYLSGSLASNY
jgi:hypothetical protein